MEKVSFINKIIVLVGSRKVCINFGKLGYVWACPMYIQRENIKQSSRSGDIQKLAVTCIMAYYIT